MTGWGDPDTAYRMETQEEEGEVLTEDDEMEFEEGDTDGGS